MKTGRNRNIVRVALAVATLAASACGNPSDALLPTAPSGLIAVSPTFTPGGPAHGPFESGAHDSGHPTQ